MKSMISTTFLSILFLSSGIVPAQAQSDLGKAQWLQARAMPTLPVNSTPSLPGGFRKTLEKPAPSNSSISSAVQPSPEVSPAPMRTSSKHRSTQTQNNAGCVFRFRHSPCPLRLR